MDGSYVVTQLEMLCLVLIFFGSFKLSGSFRIPFCGSNHCDLMFGTIRIWEIKPCPLPGKNAHAKLSPLKSCIFTSFFPSAEWWLPNTLNIQTVSRRKRPIWQGTLSSWKASSWHADSRSVRWSFQQFRHVKKNNIRQEGSGVFSPEKDGREHWDFGYRFTIWSLWSIW